LIEDDFEAEQDAFTILRGKEIERDTGRMSRARAFAERKRDQFDAMAQSMPQAAKKSMNGSVSNSKMRPK